MGNVKPAEIIEAWCDLFAQLNADRPTPEITYSSIRGGWYHYWLGGERTYSKQVMLAQIKTMRGAKK